MVWGHLVGQHKINSAIASFETTNTLLTEGITNLEESQKSAREIIVEKQAHIEECDQHIQRAKRVQDRIKAIIE